MDTELKDTLEKLILLSTFKPFVKKKIYAKINKMRKQIIDQCAEAAHSELSGYGERATYVSKGVVAAIKKLK